MAEMEYYFNIQIEVVLHYISFYLLTPIFLIFIRMNNQILLNYTIYGFGAVIFIPFFFPRWISNILNLIIGTIKGKRIKGNQLPKWNYNLPVPFLYYQNRKVIFTSLFFIVYSFQFSLSYDSRELLVSLIVFLALIALTIIFISFSEGTGNNSEDNKEYAISILKELDPTIEVKIFSSTAPFAYAKRNKVYIAEGVFNLEKGDIKRLMAHEYRHTKQKSLRLKYALLMILPLIAAMFFRNENSDIALQIIIYYLTIIIPYNMIRSLSWKLELDAERFARDWVGDEEYIPSVLKSQASVKELLDKGKTPFGFGLERWFLMYPPIYLQIYEALDRDLSMIE